MQKIYVAEISVVYSHTQLRGSTAPYLVYSVKQTSSKTNKDSVGQETVCILWNPRVHYHVHNSLSFEPVMASCNINTIGLPLRKVSSFLWLVKDHLTLNIPGVYSILFECEPIYGIQFGLSLEPGSKTVINISVIIIH